MIRGEAGRDLSSHGRLWIDSATGRVLKTELQVEQPAVRARDHDDVPGARSESGIAVPLEMREQYTLRQRQPRQHRRQLRPLPPLRRQRQRGHPHADRDASTDAWTGMMFVELPPGRFTMGSAASEAGRNDDEALHDVEITRPFLLGQNEVTQQEWRTVMGTAPSHFSDCGPRCPVENITFFDVQQFLDEAERHTARGARRCATGCRPKPSGNMRAARGTTGPFSTGENLTTAQANYNGKFPYADVPPRASSARRRRRPARSR